MKFQWAAYIALAAALPLEVSAGERRDLSGISIGMEKVEVESVIKSRFWLCKGHVPLAREINCETPEGQILMDFTKEATQRVTGVVLRYDNLSSLPITDIVNGVTATYGVPITESTIRDNNGFIKWTLADGSELHLSKIMDGTTFLLSAPAGQR